MQNTSGQWTVRYTSLSVSNKTLAGFEYTNKNALIENKHSFK